METNWKKLCEAFGNNPDSDFGRGFRDGWFNAIHNNVSQTNTNNPDYNRGYDKGVFYSNIVNNPHNESLC